MRYHPKPFPLPPVRFWPPDGNGHQPVNRQPEAPTKTLGARPWRSFADYILLETRTARERARCHQSHSAACLPLRFPSDLMDVRGHKLFWRARGLPLTPF